ncbi:hypothetical protein [Moraxella sp. VT-16-12]|uniref:hypothetical protein n=1 Tax=Moraxella sp. VT-16-12 TaxID=2014877 RepID=UPI000B7D4855|nr:hypothetical protein [Moraxella sp. VT-16-12]TWV84688.1 hypothetical protein CEW93_000475 [Moraxella sp. VT-16-12]
MKKSLSKLAILATLAVLSSNAMAYKIYERKTESAFIGSQKYEYVNGVCNHGNSFAGSYSSSKQWEVVVNSPFKMGFSSSMHEAIRQACGE